MSIKQATYRERKTVLVSVYVEKPRRREPPKHHTIIKQELIQHKLGGGGKGYNRRAQLLHYSRSLRESAPSPAFKALPSKSVPSTDQQKPSNKDIVGVQRKATYSRTPGCFDKWRIVVPSFMRCLAKKDVSKTRNNRMKAVMKSLQLQELPDVPLLLSLHNLCSTLKCTSPSTVIFRSAVINAGYHISGTHVNPLGLKSDAPMDVIWDIMRCWVKNHPVKAQSADQPGNVILAKEPVLQANFARAVASLSKAQAKKVA